MPLLPTPRGVIFFLTIHDCYNASGMPIYRIFSAGVPDVPPVKIPSCVRSQPEQILPSQQEKEPLLLGNAWACAERRNAQQARKRRAYLSCLLKRSTCCAVSSSITPMAKPVSLALEIGWVLARER